LSFLLAFRFVTFAIPPVHAVCDLRVALVGGALVDQGRPHRTAAHPVHQFAGARAGGRRDRVAGVAQIVEVEAGRQANGRDRPRPVRRPAEVPRP
jgi:hypothetical protein